MKKMLKIPNGTRRTAGDKEGSNRKAGGIGESTWCNTCPLQRRNIVSDSQSQFVPFLHLPAGKWLWYGSIALGLPESSWFIILL